MAPTFEVLLLAMAALVAFGAAAAIALSLPGARGPRHMLTITAVALLVLAGAAAYTCLPIEGGRQSSP
jgi:hypothetical protein